MTIIARATMIDHQHLTTYTGQVLADTQNSMKKNKVRTRPGGRTARVGRKVEEVTVHLLSEKGYDGLSYKEVAEAAGVNRSTLYRRWPSRAAMVLSAIRRIVGNHVLFEDTDSLLNDLRVHLLGMGDFLDSNVGKNVLIATLDMQHKGELTFDDGLSWAELSQNILPIFERATERGELPDNFDAEGAFAMLSGALHFRVIVMRGRADSAWVDRILKLFAKQFSLAAKNQ